MPVSSNIDIVEIKKILSEIPDPEIPVITISELGILRSVETDGEKVIVSITPTYSGCPALHAIEQQIKEELLQHGVEKMEVKTVYAPVWTTDWLSEEAKQKLNAYGISPPGKLSVKNLISGDRETACPRCGSKNVKMISMFGSTACKALFACKDCGEPFDQFKCH
jgi:ring-1,2-phenylacetyl-CoA epoxidase subunit PaaD